MTAPPTPHLLRLRENTTLPAVPLSPAQAAALRAAARPEQLTIAPSWAGGYDLSAGGVVGVIVLPGWGDVGRSEATGGQIYSDPTKSLPVASPLHIQIEPKVPLDNLFYMLTYAHELGTFGRDEAPLAAGASIFDAVAKIFIRQVDDIARRGIHRGYIEYEEDAAWLRGRLLVGRQARRGPMALGFHQQTNEFTADVLENRVLRAALELLARVRFRDPELGPGARRALLAFAEASPGATAADCGRVVFTRLNERYRSPINLARLFLRYLSLEGQSGNTPFVTFLVPMHQLFERFVARLLRDHLAGRTRFHLATQAPIWLDTDQRLKAQPDLVLKYDGRPYLVLDTKYKVYGDRPTNADIYQMVTYCHTLGVGRGMLIYPSDAPVEEEHQLRAGVRLELRALSLAGPLAAFRARCAAFVSTLAGRRETTDFTDSTD